MTGLDTVKHLPVYRDVVTLIMKYAYKLGLSDALVRTGFDINRSEVGEVETSDDAREFAKDLEKRGPAYVKLGQLLSTRADLLPQDWLVELQRLQDDVNPVPFSEIREILEEELGSNIESAFSELEEEPLASASLGQVHRARLKSDGRKVAVKVQRPGAKAKVLDDLAGVFRIAKIVEERSETARRYRIATIAGEARKRIAAELDYNREAASLDQIRGNLSKFPNLSVPAPIPDLCSERVLTMEFVEGSRVTDLKEDEKQSIDGPSLATELFRAYLNQVLVDGFFHADPHPGNVLLNSEGKIALIDMGMVGYVSHNLRNLLLNLLISIADKDGDSTAEVAIKIGQPMDHFEREAFTSEINELVNARGSASVEDLQLGNAVMRVMTICGEHGLFIPQEMYLIAKMLLNLDMVGYALDPEFRPDETVRREASKLTLYRIRDTLSSANFFSLLLDAKELIAETPKRVNRVLGHLANNDLRLNVETVDEKSLLTGIEQIANRITSGVVLGAMILGASLMMRIRTDFTIFGYPGIAMLLFLLATIGGLLLLWQMLRNHPGQRR